MASEWPTPGLTQFAPAVKGLFPLMTQGEYFCKPNNVNLLSYPGLHTAFLKSGPSTDWKPNTGQTGWSWLKSSKSAPPLPYSRGRLGHLAGEGGCRAEREPLSLLPHKLLTQTINSSAHHRDRDGKGETKKGEPCMTWSGRETRTNTLLSILKH